MDRTGARRKKWILWLGLPAALAVLAAAVLLLAGGAGLSARYDVPAEVTAGYDPSAGAETSLENDGTLTVRLTREDIYWYARRCGIMDAVEERLAGCGASSMGFRLADSRLTVYTRIRTLGLLPLSYRAECDVSWDGSALVVSPQRVWLGQRISLPESRWPELYGDELRLSMEDVTSTVVGACLRGDALELRLEGLRSRTFGQLRADRSLLEAMRVFSPPEVDEAVVSWLAGLPEDEISMDQARELCLSTKDVVRSVTELLACAESESVPSVWEAMDDFVRRVWGRSLSESAALRREALDAYLNGEQSKYEKLLSAVREMYKSGSLAIAETGFTAAGKPLDPGSLTSLSATATDCRVVFLWARSRTESLCTEGMPCVDDVPRAGRRVMEGLLTPGAVYDLGVALTSEGGVPLLLHRSADGSFVMREIGESLYVSLLVEHSNPVLCMDRLPVPGARLPRPAGEGWTGGLILTERTP